MFPIVLDTARVRILLAGRGPLFDKRRKALEEAGARPVCSDSPTEADVCAAQVVFVAGLEPAEAERVAAWARAAGVLVNVEDVLPLCDFRTPAVVRRGDLLFSISTNGKSPALAKALRRYLLRLFPAIWSQRVERLALLRAQMRAEGKPGAEISRAVEGVVEEEGWLRTHCMR